ncbi:hypothetical protein CQ13_07570 [Bradyrhizobium retamae]|uniref:Uncharacterized protein n=1 Tax=Bradyrhizobium retamae TaxID=1300035 RepID=A0A0R3MVJ5_9BRAD|nr:hypothetical protein CQ13_07570 [Bradyrhizobium retamae]
MIRMSDFSPTFGNVSLPFPCAARSRFERGKVAQTLLDIVTLLFLALLVVALAGSVGWSFFILGFLALQ